MFSLPFFKKNFSKNKIKPAAVIVLDGFGLAPVSMGNAISEANTPNLNYYQQNFPYGQLIAAGESVGLPANEAGNSEVGHLTIGAGKVIYQSLPRINMAIEDGSFYENRALLDAISHILKNKSRLHIMGLASSGSVHSSLNHLYALIELCRRKEIGGVSFHLFTDGRDAAPTEGLNVISEVERKLEDTKVGRIITISGRYYAMDRDGRWTRTQKAYEAIVSGKGNQSTSPSACVKEAYAKGQTDEFIEPTVIQYNDDRQRSWFVNDNDAVIFFNFRIDRPRQLTMAFVFPNFESLKSFEFGYVPHEGKAEKGKTLGPTFVREKQPKNLYFVTMTEYQKNIPVSGIAFPTFKVTDTLGEVVQNANIKQLHLAESEKERMVTYYFNGLTDKRFENEDVVIVPSPRVPTYDKKPEMSAQGIANEFKKALGKDIYGFYVVNFANPDMVAHTGNLAATKKAIGFVDKYVGEIVNSVLTCGGVVFITADHGNAEELLTYPIKSFFFTSSEGSVNTEHSNNPVPYYIISPALFKKKGIPRGSLSDVAPTVLYAMGLPRGASMTGKNLLEGQILR